MVMSALAEPPWCVCSACLGTPAVFTLGVMQLTALLGFPCWLTQVGCSTPAVMVSHEVGGCLVTVVLFPPCFLFCAYAASPSAAFWASPAPLACWGGCGFAPCVRVFQLRCCLLGLQVGFPCCLFLTLGGCTSG